MTTEDDFHAALDAHPEDWQTRLVFSDWLEERGDPRAEGYRALGVLKLCGGQRKTVIPPRGRLLWFFWNADERKRVRRSISKVKHSGIPGDWFFLLPTENSNNPSVWRGYTKTRREVEEAAVIAFSKLPDERRAVLLAIGGSS